MFQPVAMEVQISLGENSEIIITRLCSHDDQRGDIIWSNESQWLFRSAIRPVF